MRVGLVFVCILGLVFNGFKFGLVAIIPQRLNV